MSATPAFIASAGQETNAKFQIYVVFTNPEATKRALVAANRLALDLEASIVLVAAQEVPYPLPLDQPPVSVSFFESALTSLAGDPQPGVSVRVYLCRDRNQTLRRTLRRGSIIVIGASNWRLFNRERTLARILRREGHTVIRVNAAPRPRVGFQPREDDLNLVAECN